MTNSRNANTAGIAVARRQQHELIAPNGKELVGLHEQPANALIDDGGEPPRQSQGALMCVIFATLSNSSKPATLEDQFSVPMLRIYYNMWGCCHEISGRKALYRGRWPQDER